MEREGLQVESLVDLVALREVRDQVASASRLWTEEFAGRVGRIEQKVWEELVEPGDVPLIEGIDERVHNLTGRTLGAIRPSFGDR